MIRPTTRPMIRLIHCAGLAAITIFAAAITLAALLSVRPVSTGALSAVAAAPTIEFRTPVSEDPPNLPPSNLPLSTLSTLPPAPLPDESVPPATAQSVPSATAQSVPSAIRTLDGDPLYTYPGSSWQRLTLDQIRDLWGPLVSAYDWSLDEALLVILCESAGDARVVSSGGCVGLFQICGSGDPRQYVDPHTNISTAYSKYRDGASRGNRWYHWNQFGSCGHFF